jgi:hypothetical protein
MTYWNGFIAGIFVGFFTTLIATGHIIIVEYTESFRIVAFLALFIVFLFGLGITFYHAKERKSLFDPTTDGFITGIGFIETVIIFLLYGYRL